MALKPEQEQLARPLLKELPLFAGCSDEQVTALAARLNSKEVGAGKVAMMDQEIGKTLYILAKGNVSVWKRFGGEKQRLAGLAAPNFFGERTMFEESPASAMVKTDDACSLYTLEKSDFDQVVQKFPEMTELIRKNMEIVRTQRMGPSKPATQQPS